MYVPLYRPRINTHMLNQYHALCYRATILFTGGVADTPKADTSPRADTPLPSACWDTPPSTATAADGTHPTGMHSCYFYLLTQVSMRCKMKIKISRNITHRKPSGIRLFFCCFCEEFHPKVEKLEYPSTEFIYMKQLSIEFYR